MWTRLFVLLLLASSILTTPAISYGPERCRDASDYEQAREDVLTCLHLYADADGDGEICIEEMVEIRRHTLGPLEKLVSFEHPPSEIMRRCDHNQDGFISPDDLKKSHNTCLKDCPAIRDVFYYVCARAAKQNLQPDKERAKCSAVKRLAIKKPQE